MSWLPEGAQGASDFERVFGLRPNLHAAWREFASLFWTEGLVDPVLLELCRLRIAGMHGAEAPLAARMPQASEAGLGEAKIAALDGWWREEHAGLFDAGERACLRFAEQFVLDASAISDAEAAAVVALLGDAGMVAFVEALAIFDGFSRFCRILEIAPDAPAAGSPA